MPSGKRALLYRIVDGVTEKRCPRCLSFKPHTSQFFHAAGLRGLCGYCKPCQVEAAMASDHRRVVAAAGLATAA